MPGPVGLSSAEKSEEPEAKRQRHEGSVCVNLNPTIKTVNHMVMPKPDPVPVTVTYKPGESLSKQKVWRVEILLDFVLGSLDDDII